jgi:hypothetical protein
MSRRAPRDSGLQYDLSSRPCLHMPGRLVARKRPVEDADMRRELEESRDPFRPVAGCVRGQRSTRYVKELHLDAKRFDGLKIRIGR